MTVVASWIVEDHQSLEVRWAALREIDSHATFVARLLDCALGPHMVQDAPAYTVMLMVIPFGTAQQYGSMLDRETASEVSVGRVGTGSAAGRVLLTEERRSHCWPTWQSQDAFWEHRND